MIFQTSKRWYLDHRKVKPGDVLVTMGRGLRSKFIAATSHQKFSHAALCLAPALLYEADAMGVYPTPLPFACFEDSSGQHRVGLQLHDVKDAALLRHDAIAARLNTEYYDVLDDFAHKAALLFGIPYSRLGRLLSALPANTALQRLGERYEQRLNRADLSREKRGLFCSELVAAIYSDLGTPLFKNLPHTVSPGSLFSESELKAVQNAICQAVPRQCTPEEVGFEDDAKRAQDPREMTVASDRKLKAMQADAEKSISAMNTRKRRR